MIALRVVQLLLEIIQFILMEFMRLFKIFLLVRVIQLIGGQKVAGIKANYFRNVTIVNNIVVTREYDFYAMQIQNQQSDGTVKEANNNIFVNGKLPGYTSQQTGKYVTHSWVTDDNQIITDVDFSSNNYKDPISFVNAPRIVNVGPYSLIDMAPTNFQLQSDSTCNKCWRTG